MKIVSLVCFVAFLFFASPVHSQCTEGRSCHVANSLGDSLNGICTGGQCVRCPEKTCMLWHGFTEGSNTAAQQCTYTVNTASQSCVCTKGSCELVAGTTATYVCGEAKTGACGACEGTTGCDGKEVQCYYSTGTKPADSTSGKCVTRENQCIKVYSVGCCGSTHCDGQTCRADGGLEAHWTGECPAVCQAGSACATPGSNVNNGICGTVNGVAACVRCPEKPCMTNAGVVANTCIYNVAHSNECICGAGTCVAFEGAFKCGEGQQGACGQCDCANMEATCLNSNLVAPQSPTLPGVCVVRENVCKKTFAGGCCDPTVVGCDGSVCVAPTSNTGVSHWSDSNCERPFCTYEGVRKEVGYHYTASCKVYTCPTNGGEFTQVPINCENGAQCVDNRCVTTSNTEYQTSLQHEIDGTLTNRETEHISTTAAQDAQAYTLIIVAVGVPSQDVTGAWSMSLTLSVTGTPTDTQINSWCTLLKATVARALYPTDETARHNVLEAMQSKECRITRDVPVKRATEQQTGLTANIGIPAPSTINQIAAGNSGYTMFASCLVVLVALFLLF